MSAILLYSTAPSTDEAFSLGRALVEKRLAACINVLPGMRSCYWWEGKLETAEEAVLIVKTTPEKQPEAMAELQRLHPYDCPAVLSLPVSGSEPYLAWIAAETGGGE